MPTLTGWSTAAGYLRTGVLRPLGQPHRHGLALAVADDGDLRLLARAERRQRGAQVLAAAHRLARGGDDDVAPLLVGLRLEADALAVASAQAPLVGRPALADLLHPRAAVGAELEALAELRIDVLRRHAEEGVVDGALLAQLLHRALDGVHRHREAHAAPAPARRADLRVDPQHAPLGVEQRPARVAPVDRRVGLDRVVDREAGQRVDRAVERRDDPDRERLLLAERAADRGDGGADRQGAGRAERQRPQRQAGGVDPQQRDVGERVEADDLRRDLVVVLEPDEHLVGLADGGALATRHDVRVRGDLAPAGDHEPRAQAGAIAAAPLARVADPRGDDRHDPGRLAAVDARGVEAAAALPRRPGVLEDLDARGRRLRAHGLRVVAGAPAAGHEQRGEERRNGRGGARARAGPRATAVRHAGSSSEKVVRPGTLSADSSPAMRSASSWAIARPRPEPWASSEVKKGSKMRDMAARLMPVP